MKILGIDTSTKFLCIGAYDDGNTCEYNMDLGRLHSRLIMVAVKRVIESMKWDLEDIDYFACGLGPGSFTGLRIGIAAIKGLAFSLNKPVLGFSSLDILAENIDMDGPVVPAIDAKRNLIYCGIYRNKQDELKRVSSYMLISIDEFIKKLPRGSIILGDAVSLYKNRILAGVQKAAILDEDFWYPRAGNIISLALKQIEGKKISNAFDIKPIYLYPKECQIKNLKFKI